MVRVSGYVSEVKKITCNFLVFFDEALAVSAEIIGKWITE